MGNKGAKIKGSTTAQGGANNLVEPTVPAKELSDELKTNLEEIFNMIDTDGDGTLDRNEILVCFEKANGRTSKALKYFTSMDENRDGNIKKAEYMAFWESLANRVTEDQIKVELQTLEER